MAGSHLILASLSKEAKDEKESGDEYQDFLKSVREKFEKNNKFNKNLSADYRLSEEKINIILKNLETALQKKYVTTEEASAVNLVTIRDVFITSYGLTALSKKLFTLKETQQIQTSVFMDLMTDKGILFLENLKNQGKNLFFTRNFDPQFFNELIDAVTKMDDCSADTMFVMEKQIKKGYSKALSNVSEVPQPSVSDVSPAHDDNYSAYSKSYNPEDISNQYDIRRRSR